MDVEGQQVINREFLRDQIGGADLPRACSADRNIGKSTGFEAIDLVLGPDRLNPRPSVGEHDFQLGKYLSTKPSAIDGTDTPGWYGRNPALLYVGRAKRLMTVRSHASANCARRE